MAVPFEVIYGRLVVVNQGALLLLDQTQKLYLRFALTELNSGGHVFPESILDDWGKEIKNLAIYDWLRENAIHFPRAELFGCHPDEIPVQRFLRELDLTRGHVCYVYRTTTDPLKNGFVVSDVVLPEEGAVEPRIILAPNKFGAIMQAAELRWWLADWEDERQRVHLEKYSSKPEND